jgi:hypothetical protein
LAPAFPGFLRKFYLRKSYFLTNQGGGLAGKSANSSPMERSCLSAMAKLQFAFVSGAITGIVESSLTGFSRK